jgi:hypothetical protein
MLTLKLFHKLFGFDYCVIAFGFSDKILRIRKTPSGTRYVWYCGTMIEVDDKDSQKVYRIRFIT